MNHRITLANQVTLEVVSSRQPPSSSDLERLKELCPGPLPDDYLALMTDSDGIEAFVLGEDGERNHYLVLHDINYLIGLRSEPVYVEIDNSDLLATFGSDGAALTLVLDYRDGLVPKCHLVDLLGWPDPGAGPTFPTFSEFLVAASQCLW